MENNNLANCLEVHLPIPEGKINPLGMSHRAFPIKDENIPIINLKEIAEGDRVDMIYRIIDLLNVETCSRYQPTETLSYCNVYAHDFAYCLGAYIPRVWWDEESISKILSGEVIDIKYANTVFELNCNSLSNWFNNYGIYFNWVKVIDPYETSKIISSGSFGVVIAKRKDLSKSGHISVIIPHTGTTGSEKEKIIFQSQAGVVNKRRFTDIWWVDEKFSTVDFWVWKID